MSQELADAPLRYRLLGYSRLTSTQDLASRLAAAGAAEGTVVLADSQSAGRGRSGHQWFGPPGSGLLLSVVLRPGAEPSQQPALALVGGLAVALGIESGGGPQVTLKWPNDCLCGGRKLAGVLLESLAAPAASRERAVILGIGCNVSWSGLELPDQLRASATACDLEGRSVDRGRLAVAILRSLAVEYRRWSEEGFAAARQQWLSRAVWLGEEIQVELPGRSLAGAMLGVGEGGELLLEGAAGPLRVHAGEASLVRRLRPLVSSREPGSLDASQAAI